MADDLLLFGAFARCVFRDVDRLFIRRQRSDDALENYPECRACGAGATAWPEPGDAVPSADD